MKNFTLLLLLFISPFLGFGQNLLQDKKITSSDRGSKDAFGWAIAVDGQDAMIGSPGKTLGPFAGAGSIHSFFEYKDGWEETALIENTFKSPADQFGTTIAMSNGICAVGSVFEDYGNGSTTFNNAGMVLLYRLENNEWVFNGSNGVIVAKNGTEDDGEDHASFGWDIVMNRTHIFVASLATGDVVEVGLDNTHSGAVYIYDLDSIRNSIQKIETDITLKETGYKNTRIAINDEYLVVGHESEDKSSSLTRTGAVYIYKLIDSSYVKTQKLLIPNAQEGEQFGNSLALNDDFLAVRSTVIGGKGKLRIYEIGNDSFSLFKTLDLGESIVAPQHSPKLLFTDNLLFVGAPEDDLDDNGENEVEDAGAVYVYDIDNDFELKQKLVARDRRKDDRFGYHFDGDETQLLISSDSDFDASGNDSLERAGAIYHFDRDGSSGLFKERKAQLSSVYPNPTTGEISIQVPNGLNGIAKLEVYSISGVLMYKETIKQNANDYINIDLQAFKSGMYLVKVSDGLNTYSQRVIKE